MSLCLIYLNNFNDFDNVFWILCLYNKLKQGISVEPDVKPAAVMNRSTLEGVVHLYDHKHEPF